MWSNDAVWTGKTTVRASWPLATGERARLARRIEALDGVPPSLPPAAILVARRLAVRLGGRYDDLALAWREGVEQLYRGAARPGAPGADSAEAIVFANEAELLAWLVADSLTGRAARRWWRAAAMARIGWPGEPSRLLAARPELLPAAVATLDELGVASAAVATLAPSEAADLARAALAAHGAGEAARSLGAARIKAADPPLDSAPGVAAVPAPAEERGDWPPAARLARVDGALRLGAERRLLLAVALTLAETPRRVRAVGFARQAADWFAAELRMERDGLTPCLTSREAPSTHASAHREASRVGPAPATPAHGPAPESLEAAPESLPLNFGLVSAISPVDQSRSPQPNRSAEAANSLGPKHSGSEVLAADGVATRLGGALYLVAAFERLGLPDCFEPAWPLARRLGRWATLELVARGLLAAAGRGAEFGDDPLWAALARLDGRKPGLAAFARWPARREFDLPATLEPEDADLCWAARGGRFALWSGAGVLLAERPIPAGGTAAEAARAEARRCAPAADPERRTWAEVPLAPLGRLAVAPALRFWLAATLPALRAWLAGAMALEAPSYGELSATLVELPARLYAGGERVDLVAPLDEVRVAVRRAALDADPGWLPGWGRAIRFHYTADPGVGGFR